MTENLKVTLNQQMEELIIKRNLLADRYNEYIKVLFEMDQEHKDYNKYVSLIRDMEPETNSLKEKIREIKRELKKLN